ncbi:YecA family protein [Pseudolysobacter antarcticus]|uniref:YecA family protein n=1 Tax=Pseudolysobacter antarcticus TaxID=2511995 RepID=A0A411HPZ0_9GAMM|nr:YecA family protein [Pseudolysobacter antarcticus]QBB72490.1 YecA family protein [Pseudolysobacter antarcticus]
MTEQDWPAVLDDAELEELDNFLRAHAGDDDLLLDGVHGLLTAVGIGPEPITPEEWLPEVLHEPFVDAEHGKRILELIARLNESVLLEIESDSYEPILGEVELEDNETTLSANGWCEGFSRGVDMRARAWETRLAADSQLMELLGPIMALAVEEGIFTADTEFAPLSDEEYEECLAQIPAAVFGIGQYWNHEPLSSLEQATAKAANAAAAAKGPPRRRGGRWVH